MKKLLSFILTIVIAASVAAAFPLNASAASKGTLTITSRGNVIGKVEVGNEFIYRVALDSAGYNVSAGQAELRTDPAYAKVIEYGQKRKDGTVYRDYYTFPQRIRNASLVSNYEGSRNRILYNFSKGISHIGAFTPDDHFFRIRFKAVAPGTVEIRHYVTSLSSIQDYNIVKLIEFDKGNKKITPQPPYTVASVEPATAYIGDADGDYKITVLDASFIQRVAAGVQTSYKKQNADVNTDGEVNLRDALNILRYKAGVATGTKIGKWVFPSDSNS